MKPFFWEIVRAEYIISGHLTHDQVRDVQVKDMKLDLYADGKWFPVQMPVNTFLSKWLIDDYQACRARRDDDHGESWRAAK